MIRSGASIVRGERRSGRMGSYDSARKHRYGRGGSPNTSAPTCIYRKASGDFRFVLIEGFS